MKSLTVIILWIFAILLGVAAYFVKFHGEEEIITRTKLAPGEKLFESLPIREIYRVTLNQGEEVTHLVRGEGNAWGVKERGDYAINYELLRSLLGSLNSLEVTQGYPADSKYFSRFGLSDDIAEDDQNRGYLGAIKVSMYDQAGAKIQEIWLGKYSGSSRVGGRFVRILGDDSGVYAVAQTFPSVTANPKDWLGKEFLQIEEMKSIALTAPADPSFVNWKLSRANSQSQFSLVGMSENEVMQLTSTNALRSLFAGGSFQDVLSKERSVELSVTDEKLKRQAMIITFDHLTYHLDFWPHKQKPKDPNTDPRLPALQPSYNLTIKVTEDFPQERNKRADETPEEGAKLDAQFTQLQKIAREKFHAAKALEGRIFQVSQSVIAPLQKERSDFVTPQQKPAAGAPGAIPPLQQPVPQG